MFFFISHLYGETVSQDNEKQGGRDKSKLYLAVRELLQGARGEKKKKQRKS